MTQQITEIENDIREEITIDANGHGFITGRGLARLLGVNQASRFTAARMASKVAEILTQHGFNPAAQAAVGYPDIVLIDIAFYYAVDAQRTTEEARQVIKVLGSIGARVWMQKVVGWEEPRGQEPQMLWDKRMKLYYRYTRIPHGYWCIFQVVNDDLVRMLEREGFVFPPGRCPDISVGLCWNRYLREELFEDPDVFPTYPHRYPDQREVQQARLYPHLLWPAFQEWLWTIYIPVKFPKYLRNTVQELTAEDYRSISAAVGFEILPKRLRAC